MQSAVTVVLVDRTGAREFSVPRVRQEVTTDSVMVVVLGANPQRILPPTPLHLLPPSLDLPPIGPPDPAVEARAVAQAAQEAMAGSPWGGTELLLFTDPSRDEGLLSAVRSLADLRIRHAGASARETPPARPVGSRPRTVALVLVAVVVALGLLLTGTLLGGFMPWRQPQAATTPAPAAGPGDSPDGTPRTTRPATTSAATNRPATTGPTTTGPATTRASTTSPATTTTTDPVGRWSGAVTGDRSSYNADVVITAAQPLRATVTYPQLDCSGDWRETGRTGGVIQVTETITYGTTRCKQTVAISVRTTGDQLVVEFTGAAGQPVTARLSRV